MASSVAARLAATSISDAPSSNFWYGSPANNFSCNRLFWKRTGITSNTFRSQKTQVVATLSDAVVVAKTSPSRRFSHLSDLLSKLTSGADVSSTLEPWLDKLAIEDWNTIVADVGKKHWTLAMQVFSVLREKSAVWDKMSSDGKRASDGKRERGVVLEPNQSTEHCEFEVTENAPALLKIYTTLVSVLSRHGRRQEVVSVQELMKQAKIEADVVFYNALLESYATRGMVAEFSTILLHMERTGVKPDHVTYEKLISAHLSGENPQLDRATQILKTMTKEGLRVGVGTFRDLINAFWKEDNAEGAEEVFEAMQLAGYVPDMKVILKLMQLHGRRGQYKRNVELSQMLKMLNIQPNGSVYDYLLHAYCKAGLTDQALVVFRKYKLGLKPSLVAFNMVIDACGKQGLHTEAVQLYADLCNSGMNPNTVTYTSVIAAMVKVGRYEKAEQLYRRMLKQKVLPSMHTYTIMIHCYTKRNWTRVGHEMYNAMRRSQIGMTGAVYGTVLALYVEGGWYKHAAAILKEMEIKGFDLDAASHGVLIRAFGEIEEKTAPLARVVKDSKFEVCKLLTSLFIANQRSSKMEPLVLEMVLSFLERWNEMGDLEGKSSIYNAMLDTFWRRGLRGTARTVLRQARDSFAKYTYPQFNGLEWVLDVRGLSIGGAKIALVDWLIDAAEMADKSLVADSTMVLITGSGEFLLQGNDLDSEMKGLKGTLLSMLGELGSPFVESPKKARKLQAGTSDVLKWISQGVVRESINLSDCS